MSTQNYYKEKLGFDPKETYYNEGPPEKYRRTDGKTQGYEENLNKFKGTIWDLFIESLEGTVKGSLILSMHLVFNAEWFSVCIISRVVCILTVVFTHFVWIFPS